MVNSPSPMQRLWLIFAQTATVRLAVLFRVRTLKPERLPSRVALVPVAIQQQAAHPPGTGARTDSYHDAVKRAAPAVVNVSTSKEVRVPSNPLLNDPLFRRFFGDSAGDQTRKATSL